MAAGSILLGGCTVRQGSLDTATPRLPTNGPLLYPQEEHGLVCTSAKKRTRFILATHTNVAAGHRVRINRVAPFEASALEVESVYIVPIPTNYFEMLIEPIPPRGDFREAWKRRTPAVGAVVESTAHVQLTAVLNVAPDKVSSLGGIEITYTDLGTDTDFVVRTNLSLKVEPEACGR